MILGRHQNLNYIKTAADFYGYFFCTYNVGVVWPGMSSMKQLKADLSLNSVKFKDIKISFELRAV